MVNINFKQRQFLLITIALIKLTTSSDYWRPAIRRQNIAIITSDYCQEKKKKALLRACLHGGGGPQIGEITYGGAPNLTCKRDQIQMKDYMDRQATPPTGLPRVPHLHVNIPWVV